MVYESHGYHDDNEWSEVLGETRAAAPDIVFVGLGMPREAMWAQQFKSELPPALILAAGGFFGHVVGDEKRAPDWAQKVGMEWMWRVGQAPQRLAARYAKGLVTTVILSAHAFRNRR
jgi:exopolysaccharide biosynthesis WecB/TagA/CpsF family protein